jgi:hypothetical protein
MKLLSVQPQPSQSTLSILHHKSIPIMIFQANALHCIVLLSTLTSVAWTSAILKPESYDVAIPGGGNKASLETRGNLHSRPKVKMLPLHSDEELVWIKWICTDIQENYRTNDFWFFVGNSGGYVFSTASKRRAETK